MDPLTGRSVGPLCLCRVKDERRRRALMAIAHFPETTVRKLKHRENPEGGLPDFMAAPIRQYVEGKSPPQIPNPRHRLY